MTLPDIAAERAAIEQAPTITPLPAVGRCSFCGRLAASLVPVEVVDGQERFACPLCAGGRGR